MEGAEEGGLTGSVESKPEPASGACFSFSQLAVAKAQREEARWDGVEEACSSCLLEEEG